MLWAGLLCWSPRLASHRLQGAPKVWSTLLREDPPPCLDCLRTWCESLPALGQASSVTPPLVLLTEKSEKSPLQPPASQPLPGNSSGAGASWVELWESTQPSAGR